MNAKINERRHLVKTHLWCQQDGAEEFGREEEVPDWQALADEAHEISGQVGSEDRSKLFLVLGAPFNPVDLPKYLAHPVYSPHIDDARIPPALEKCVECRNNRIEVFKLGDARRRSALAKAGLPLPSHGTESVRLLMGLLAAYGDEAHELGPGRIPGVSHKELSARHEEVYALREAVKACIAKPQSWQLGHILILRHFAGQDLELTPKTETKLDKVIALRRQRQAAKCA
jgi:hypothetical protein